MMRLRSYIAPGAPATRCPCDGTESTLRVEFGFTPRWYRERLDIDFSERWHCDPLYRHQTLVRMREELNRRFPELALGGPAPKDYVGSLDGVHGAMIVAMAFGIPVEYYADNWPAAKHAYLSESELARLEVPDLANTPVILQLLEQMETLDREFGRIEGYINWQGVLNNAYRLRGPEILADPLTDAGLARHIFEVVTETMIAGMRLIYERQRQSGVIVRHATVSNCLVNMASPDIYRAFLLPCDARIAAAFEGFGVHNCAWNVDPYIDDYATIPTLGYVDMGLDSNLSRARECCPETRRAVMYTPMDLANKTLPQLRADLERIHRELGPCDVVMADIEAGTPDERVLAFAELAKSIAADPA